MARKRKDAVAEVTGAVPESRPEEQVADPVGKAPGPSGERTAERPAGGRKAAVRMMTRSVAEAKPGRPESAARRANTAARPSRKPAGGRNGRGR